MKEKITNDFVIDTANNKYILDGKDIGDSITSIDLHLDSDTKKLTINFADKETAIKGTLIPDKYLQPLYCSSGEKLCDYSFDCTLYCTKCQKTTRVLFGQYQSE